MFNNDSSTAGTDEKFGAPWMTPKGGPGGYEIPEAPEDIRSVFPNTTGASGTALGFNSGSIPTQGGGSQIGGSGLSFNPSSSELDTGKKGFFGGAFFGGLK
jgi:hypothetical protein